MNTSPHDSFWHGFNRTAGVLIFFFLLGLPLLFALAQFIQGVDMSLNQAPSGEAGTTSFTVHISNENNTALNAVEFELSYDPQALAITRIVPHETLCEDQFVISNTINNASGTALFQCGTTHPFSAASGTVATVYALPRISGTTTVLFGPLTHVLAHDGLGTDATRNRTPLVISL